MAYYTAPITAADLGTYLGTTVDDARASQLIELAMDLCRSISDPLPDGSAAVVMDVVARAYVNPSAAPTQSAGPFAVGGSPGGLWLTRSNKATLRRLGGSGGAFTIDTMPATAGQGLPWWGRNAASDDDSWDGTL